jgi:hypothetical protein
MKNKEKLEKKSKAVLFEAFGFLKFLPFFSVKTRIFWPENPKNPYFTRKEMDSLSWLSVD